MDATANYDASSRTSSLHSGGPSKTSRDSESTGEIVARFELDIAFICERLTNLNLLSMHVETRESDFEPLVVSDMDPELVVKVLEYDLLAGVLGSEVRVLETHISDLQIEKSNVSEFLLSRKHLGEPVVGMEDMLQDSEKSLAQLLEQVLDLKVRSASFDRNVLRFAGNNDYKESSKDDIEQKEKMKMQTVEHQRHILRMLEKSLEREIDSEKRVFELTQIEETLTMRVRILEEEVVYAEEEAETTLENFYEADHSSELLMETSKELLSRIKMLHFNLKGSVQREAELKSDLLKLQQANEKASTQVMWKRMIPLRNSRIAMRK